MKIKVEYTTKDGNSHVKYTKVYDMSKPTVWVDGFEYKFNNEIVDVQPNVPAMGVKVTLLWDEMYMLLKDLIEAETHQPTLFVPIGASGTGKSTYLKKLRETNPDILSFSFDDLRHEWYDKEDYGRAFQLSTEDKEFNNKAYNVFRDMIKTGQDIYVDNTNLTAKRRAFYINEAKRRGYRTVGIEMPVDVETIVARQKTRGDKNVKETAVRDQFARLQRPQPNEFDEVVVSNHNLEDK